MQNPWAAAVAAKKRKGEERPSEEVRNGSTKEVVVTNKAFKLASAWVQNMTGGADFDAEEEAALPENDDSEVRPVRLGLGAKYLSHSQASRTTNQVEQKLHKKLNAGRNTLNSYGGLRESKASSDGKNEVDEDEEENGSRASAFKKRPVVAVKPALMVSKSTGSKMKKKRGTGF